MSVARQSSRVTGTAAVCVLLTLLSAGAARAADPPLSGRGDFANIAKNGFLLNINGAFFKDTSRTQWPNLVPNALGSVRNNYAQSMAWFDGKLYVGTARDTICLGGLSSGDCFGPSGFPGPNQRAEIWRFTPSANTEPGAWGLNGTWERLYQSPYSTALSGLRVIGGFLGVPEAEQIPTDVPRDFAYRGMTVCDAGDQVQRLYVATFGLPGNILYQTQTRTGSSFWSRWLAPTTTTFQPTSTTGLNAAALDIVNGTADLGYRALACFKGRLWTSPAGGATDVDASLNPVVLMNPNPANGGAWQTVFDVTDANPSNEGIFQIDAVGDYLYVTTVNRENGFELWRGDGTNCRAPWQGDGQCNLTWTRVINAGGGRPDDVYGPTSTKDNAIGVLGVLGSDLYVGATESGFFESTLAEMMRVPNAGAPGPVKWELLVGWPRRDWESRMGAGQDLENFQCATAGYDMPNANSEFGNLWPLAYGSNSLTALDDDPDADDCPPLSNAGPGLGKLPTTGANYPLAIGSASYFWRFAEHQGELFIGTLDLLGSELPYNGNQTGADLWRTTNGVDFVTVDRGGLGNPAAYGIRTLLSTPIGLAVGTANPYGDLVSAGEQLGGLDVHIGTTAPGAYIGPKVNPGADQLIFDTGGTGQVAAKLNPSGSLDGFGGAGPLSCDWYLGTLTAEQCANPAGLTPVSTTQDCGQSTTVNLVSRDGAGDIFQYQYTLRVQDQDGDVNCATTNITASSNLAPSVQVTPSVPFSIRENRSPYRSNLKLVDFDGDGNETYEVTGVCKDPDGDAVTRCEFSALDAGNTVSDMTMTCLTQDECIVKARVTTKREDLSQQVADTSRPDVVLDTRDSNGYTRRFGWESYVQRLLDNAGANDRPVCRSAVLAMQPDGVLSIDPAANLSDGYPLCADPEGLLASYRVEAAGEGSGSLGPFGGVTSPAAGSSTAVPGPITYTPDADTTLDVFEITALDQKKEAADTGSNNLRSRPVALRIQVDGVAPQAQITGTPATAAACGTPEADLCGTATDELSGVGEVKVSIQRNSDSAYWNGATWVADETLLAAQGTTSWRYLFTPEPGIAYTASVKALDLAGNEGTPATQGFTRPADQTPPTLGITFPGAQTYSIAAFAQGCGTSAADVCGTASDASGVASVEISIRNAGGQWWNGTTFQTGAQQWLPATLGGQSWNRAFTPPADGAYSLNVRARDTLGNEATQSVSFTRQRSLIERLLGR